MQLNRGKAHVADENPGTDSRNTVFVRRAVKGDRAAFDQLVSIFHEPIFRMVYVRTRSRVDTEDLTQDIFIQAFKSIGRLREVDRFRSWLYSIAANRVRDFHRKKRLRSFFMISSGEEIPGADSNDAYDDPEPLKNVMRKDFWGHLGGVFGKLSRLEKEVFTMRFIDQLTLREIAESLGKGESTVKTHLYRALKKFRKEKGILKLVGGEIQ
jgi:RNA polymerase sigma-70 factor (ECF subfamily)